jgi:hypothetical protein
LFCVLNRSLTYDVSECRIVRHWHCCCISWNRQFVIWMHCRRKISLNERRWSFKMLTRSDVANSFKRLTFTK